MRHQFVILIFVPWGGNAENRPKRTLPLEAHNYAGINQGLSYSDNFGSYFSNGLQNMYSNYQPLALSSAPQPLLMKFSNQATNAKVTSKPMLYEYQPTPSNVIHAGQSVQPVSNFNQPLPNLNAQQLQTQTMTPHSNFFRNGLPSETVILPVQPGKQATLAHENNEQIYPDSKPRSVHNNQQAVSGKYFYANGKLIFDSDQVPYSPQNMNRQQTNTAVLLPSQQSQQYYQQQQKTKKPPIIDDVNRGHFPRQKTTQANISPMTNKATSLQKKPFQSINESLKVPLQKSKKIEPVDDDYISTKENDDTEINSEVDVDYLREHERNPIFGRYSFDYDESEENDRDHGEIEDDDGEEEHNERDFTKYTNQKKLSKTGKTNTDDHINKYISSGTEGKYDHSKMKSTKSNKKPSMFYKSIKSSSEIENPKTDSLEGRYSEDLPVTHNHKIFRGKWYISKNTDV